jgi:TetR/AcrR family transcriptional regulator, repressor of fatR-cypB operon
MARLIDTSKIESIKLATLHLVVEKGYGGASIAEIAKRADVAEGYLYRFYKSKYDLVSDLLFQSIKEIMDELDALLSAKNITVKMLIKKLIQKFFKEAYENPEKVKFLFVLMHDYNFSIVEEQRTRVAGICKKVKELGLVTNEIRKEITEEDVYLIAVSMPIQFINLRFKKIFTESALDEKELKRLLNNCIHYLK